MNTIIERVRQALINNIDEKTQRSAQNFFKEEIKGYGVKVPVVNKIGETFFREMKNCSKQEVFALCEELWRSGYMEESFVACHWSYAVRAQYEVTDLEIFERWIRHFVNNWASCDTLCNHTVGEFLEMYPECISRLYVWAEAENRWMRRAAAVSLIIPARKGLFFDDILKIALILLHDTDDLVRKGYGWMLKAASEAHQKDIFDFVILHKAMMPRTALRYAIEKMPPEMKAEAMKK